MKASMYQTNPNKEDQVKYVIVIVKGSEQPQTTEECGSIGHGPLTRPSATLSHWERGWGWGWGWGDGSLTNLTEM